MDLHRETSSPLEMEQKRLTILLSNQKGQPLPSIVIYAEAISGTYIPIPWGELADELRKLPLDTQNKVVSYLQTHLAYNGKKDRLKALLRRIAIELRKVDDPSAWMIESTVDRQITIAELQHAGPVRTIPLGILATDHVGFVSFSIEGRNSARYKLYPGLANAIDVDITQRSIATGDDAILVKLALNSGSSLRTATLPSMQDPGLIEWKISPGSFGAVPKMFVGEDSCESVAPGDFATSVFSMRQVQRITDPTNLPKPPSDESRESDDLDEAIPSNYPTALINEYSLSIIPIGHSLGQIKYTLPLAPGESVRLAVTDWRRQDSGSRTEDTKFTEALIHDQTRDRVITETVQAALSEWQRGGSIMGGMAAGGGAAGSTGVIGAAGGVESSIGGAYTTSSGTRNLTADTMQKVADAIHQESNAQRELRSSVVVQTDQQESQNVHTRTFFNNNRGHTMTILYCEILRNYRLVVRYKRTIRAVLLPRQSWNLADIPSLLSKSYILRPNMLDTSLNGNWDALRRADAVTKERVRNPPVQQWKDDGALEFTQFHFVFQLGSDSSTNGIHLFVHLKSLQDPDRPKELTIGENPNWNANEQFNNEDSQLVLDSDPVSPPIFWGDIIEFEIRKTSSGDDLTLNDVAVTGYGDFGEKSLRSMQGFAISLSGEWPEPGSAAPLAIIHPGPKVPINQVPTWEQQVQADDYALAMQLIDHLQSEKEYYTRILDLSRHPNQYASEFETMPWGTNPNVHVIDKVSPVPSEIVGTNLAFPMAENIKPHLQLQSQPPVERLISFSARGVFAEAKLGQCNVAEEIDETRFWRWDEHPNPMLATDINPVSIKSPDNASVSGTLGVSNMPNATVTIQNPPAAPDPTGMANLLNAITKSDSFRDMSATKEVAGMINSLIDASVKMAQAASSLVKPPSGDHGGSSQPEITGPGSQSSGGWPAGTTTTQQQTTPNEAHDAAKVVENQMAKGNISREEGKKIISSQVSNMKGSKEPDDLVGRQRGIQVFLIGHGGNALRGKWTWDLTQFQVVPGPENVVVNSGLGPGSWDDTPSVYEDGRIVIAFTQDPNTGETFTLHLKGNLLGTKLQEDVEDPLRPLGMPIDQNINIRIPSDVFNKGNVATVTITAVEEKFEVVNKKGSVAAETWELAAKGEGPNQLLGVIPGVGPILAAIVGGLSGKKSWTETNTVETVQTWTFWYYTGAFSKDVKVE